jgi:hypothetical protein
VRPFLLFGAAVAQPPPAAAARGEGAAAAVVASRDRSLGRYSSRVLLQPAGPLSIAGLAGAARELLVDFYRVNGARKPEALLVFRAWGGPGGTGTGCGGGRDTGDAGGGGGGSGGGGADDADARAAVVAEEYAALRKVGPGGRAAGQAKRLKPPAGGLRHGPVAAARGPPASPSPTPLLTAFEPAPAPRLPQACFDLEEGYCPPITYILVSRRHHT